MFPQMKFRLTGLDPKVSRLWYVGCWHASLPLPGEVHPLAGHRCLGRLPLQVPQ